MQTQISPANGKLGVMIVGLGAVATTFVAGVELIKKGKAEPVGSVTQMGRIRIGKRDDYKSPLIKDFISLANLEDLVFAAWDIFPDNAYQSALNAGVLSKEHLELVSEELQSLKPMKAVFQPECVQRLHGTHLKEGATKMDLVLQLMEDIRQFKIQNGCERVIMLWTGSTEKYLDPSVFHPSHQSCKAFELGLQNNDPNIYPSMMYAWAAILSGVPFINGAPNLTVDIPAMVELAEQYKMPICGKDFKTGQTLIKTIIAPGLKARLLGLLGWFSVNILGNRDGEVLDHPDNFKTKEESKLSVLEHILQPELHPKLYGALTHIVRILYYPPRGDDKEGWDNIDIFGWLGYKMQIKINFLCKDSILAAPLCLDLVLFMDLAQRAGKHGVQEWLSFFFKAPQTLGAYPEHDLFIQNKKMKNTLRVMGGEQPLTHLDGEDYD